MDKFQSLADLLGAPSEGQPSNREGQALESSPLASSKELDEFGELLETTDAKQFCQRLCESRMFRRYVLNGLVLGDLPPAIATRVIDHGMGKPPERIEHTGKDGNPIESVTEVRRVIVRPPSEYPMEDEVCTTRTVTH